MAIQTLYTGNRVWDFILGNIYRLLNIHESSFKNFITRSEFEKWKANGTVINFTITGILYFGNPSIDGSYRFRVLGDDLVVERREGSVWIEKSRFQAQSSL